MRKSAAKRYSITGSGKVKYKGDCPRRCHIDEPERLKLWQEHRV